MRQRSGRRCRQFEGVRKDHPSDHHRQNLLLRAERPCHGLSAPASMTIEAALVLPFYIFFFVNLLCAFSLLRLQCDMEAACHRAGTELALTAFDIAQATGTGGGDAVGATAAAALFPGKVREYLGEDYLAHSLVEGGSDGLHFLQTGIGLARSDDVIDAVVSYEVHPLFGLVAFRNFTMQTRFYGHAWTGYDLEDESRPVDEHGEELVYITEHGTVYHRSLACRYLKPTIQQADLSVMEGQRNRGGGRYTACEICGNRKRSGEVFFTDWGDRYHCSVNCPGLKRTIYTVPISQVGGRGPCSVCGGGT